MARRCSVLLVAMLLSACGAEDPAGGWLFDHNAGGKADGERGRYSLISYNAGLAHGAVALAEERRPKVIEALRHQTADVLCLQEVWTDEDVAAVRDGLSDIYPFAVSHRTVDESDRSAPCGLIDTFRLDRCVSNECEEKGISTEECVSTLCQDRYDALDDQCKLCLAANTTGAWRCAFLGARSYANEGRNGLMLLAKRPILDARYTPFATELVKRGVISAEVDGNTIHCTHLSSDLAVVPYPRDRAFSSWKEEQAAQLEVIEAQSELEGCTILMGDLNAGPATETLSGELPESFAAVEAQGYDEPYDPRRCTWCDDNPLAGSAKNKQLDHVMTRDCPQGEFVYRRAFDLPIALTVDGDLHITRLSDHYGLRLDVYEAREESY